MTTFEQGLEVTGIGMLLVFVSLLIVAGLIWALNKLFPARKAAAQATQPAVAAPVRVVQAALPQASLADEAAAIAVALVRQGLEKSLASSVRREGNARSWPCPGSGLQSSGVKIFCRERRRLW